MVTTRRMFSRPGIKWLCVCLALAGLPRGAGAASVPLTEAAAVHQPYRVKRWTTDDGLPQNRIAALQQTRDGYLWIGTWFGLARFDGVRFTVFDKHNTSALTNDTVSALAEDTEGTLWIGTADGLLSYREHRFQRWTTAEGLPHRKVWRLSASQSGGVWLQAGDYVTLLKQGEFSRAWKVNTPVLDANIRSLQEGPDGWLHVLTAEAGLMVSPAADELRTNFLAESSGLSHLSAGWPGRTADQSWVGTLGGVYRREKGAWSAVGASELGSCSVDFMHEDRAGRLWINARPGGLKRWDGAHWTAIDLSERMTTPAVTCLSEDREGNVWVGTDQGLVQLQTRRVKAFTKRDGLADDHVWSVCEGTNGIIWLGTKQGLSRIQNDRVVPIEVTEPRPELANRCVWPSRDGGVLVAKTGLGLFEFNNGFVERIPNLALSGGGIAALYEDRSGQLWIGTGDGVTAWRDGRLVARHSKRSGQPVTDVRCILEDRDGAMWFGQQGQGLTRLKDGQFRTFTERDGLSNNRVWAMHEDAEGALWLGTENGLTRYQQGRFTTFTQQQGLLENAVNWILEDDFGHLWLSGLRGIYRVPRGQLNAVADGRAARVEVAAFGTADGMESSETNGEGQPAGWKARDGRLWFPTTHGVVVIDPKGIQVSAVVPPVVIEQVRVDAEVVFGDDCANINLKSEIENQRLDLAPGRARVLEIQYTANSLAAPERVQFKYKLEPHDHDWVNAGPRRLALYTNLRPGEYRFRVQASNPHGVWNEKGDMFRFSLAPHFYETWPFYLLCGLAVIGVAGAVQAYRLRVQRRILRLEQAQALHQERARIARDLHDDLGANLTGIALRMDLVRRHGSDPDGVSGQLTSIAASARDLVDNMRETVWAVNPRQDTLESLAGFLAQQAERIVSAAGLRCRIEMPERLPGVTMPSALRQHIYLTVKEALNNAVKHSGASEVRLTLVQEDDELRVMIGDDGRGFVPQSVKPTSPDIEAPGHGHGNGLANMRQRIAGLGGRLEIDPAPGRGTRITLWVPLKRILKEEA